MERDEIDFGTLKVSVLFRKLFIPTLFGMLSISAVTVADGIFVGHGVGSDGIAAVNIYVPLLMLFQGVGLMIGIGCSVVASIHLSRAKVKAARLNVTQAMIIVTALTLRGEVSGRGVRVDMTGGRLIIDVEYDEGRVENLYLTGPTNIVCKGELTDEELVL